MEENKPSPTTYTMFRAYVKYLIKKSQYLIEPVVAIGTILLMLGAVVGIFVGFCALLVVLFGNDPHALFHCVIGLSVGFACLGILLFCHFWYFCTNIYRDE